MGSDPQLTCGRGLAGHCPDSVRRGHRRELGQGAASVPLHCRPRSRRGPVRGFCLARLHSERALAVLRRRRAGLAVRRARCRADRPDRLHPGAVPGADGGATRSRPRPRRAAGVRCLRRSRCHGHRSGPGGPRGSAGRRHRRPAAAPPVAEATHDDRCHGRRERRARRGHRGASSLDRVLAGPGPSGRGRWRGMGRGHARGHVRSAAPAARAGRAVALQVPRRPGHPGAASRRLAGPA